MPKINREEYETLKELNDKWKWIATDGDGYVWGYENRPIKLGGIQLWDYFNGGQYKYFGPNLFQFIQWEDEEPYSIDELIDEYEEATRTVKKDREWLKEALFALRMTGKPENYRTERERELGRAQQWAWNNCVYRAYESAEQLGEQLGETNDQIDKLANFIMNEVEGEPSQSQGAVDTAIRIIKSYQNQETLSSDWIEEHSNGMSRSQYVWVDDLKELLVPKQEEVDRAYKDGYEKGREFGFYKGYREGLADKGGEPETVADVVITFWKSYERLKEVMSMEVEELEE